MGYRDHVMSAEFQADTIQLVKVDLPAYAADAAVKGKETVGTKVATFKEDVAAYYEMTKSLVPSESELKALAEKVKIPGPALLGELQAELASGVEHVKSTGFSLEDTVDRL